MMRRLALSLLLALAACAAPAATAPTPSTAPSATRAPISTPSPSATRAPAPTAAPLPAATPTPTPQPTLSPAHALTPTPPFPQGRIAPDSLAALRPLRTAGYGYAQTAAFVGRDRLAVGTSAGLLWLSLPALTPGRFDPLPGGISTLVASPDGAALAFVDSSGRSTALIRTADGTTIARLVGGGPAFSPDSRFLATGDADNPAVSLIWRAADGAHLADVRGRSPIFSPDGSLVAARDSASTALLTRVADGAILAALDDGYVAFSPDGKLLATGGPHGIQLFLIGEAGLGPARQLSERFAQFAPAFSADGGRVVGVEPFTLIAWDAAGGQELDRRKVAGDALRLGPNATLVEAITAGGDVPALTTIHRVADGAVLYEDGFPVGSTTLFSPDGARALVLRGDGEVHLVDAAAGVVASSQLRGYAAVAFSPDGSLMAAGSGDAAIDIWQMRDGALLRRLNAGSASGFKQIQRLSFSTDGTQVLAARLGFSLGADGAPLDITAWQVDGSGGSSAAGIRLDQHIYAASRPPIWDFSQPAGRLAWADEAGRLRLLDGGGTVDERPGPYSALAFSPDGGTLAAAQDAGGIRLLRAADGGDVAALDAGRLIAQLAFSPDGSLLAARSADGALTIWRVAEQAHAVDIAGDPDPQGRAPDMLISADNRLLIVGGAGGVVFYSLPDGRELRRIDGGAEGLALGPAQRLLAILSDGRVTWWGVPG